MFFGTAMRRIISPMPFAAAAFVAGICLLQTQDSLPPWEWALAFLPPLVWAIWRRARAPMLICIFFVGWGYAAYRAESRLAERVPAAHEWRDIVVEGVVRGFPDNDERRTRFDFDIERIVLPPMDLQLRARLSDYHYGKSFAFLQNGARLRMKIRIRPPRTNLNPRGFDYAGYLFARGIRAAGYVRARDKVVLLSAGEGVRGALRRRALSLPHGGELVSALLVGDRSQMRNEQWRVLRRTGVAHLFSISGTHIALVAGVAAFWGGFFWRRNRKLMRIMPAQKAALLAAIPFVAGYAWLAGLEVPVQRGALMFLAAAAAMLAGGAIGATNAIAVAAIVVTFADPWAVLSAGFWLSFMLAGAVVAASSAGGNFFIRLFKLQFLLSLFAIPLTLQFFNEASLASLPANLVAVPLTGFVILPLIFLDLFIPGDVLWYLAAEVLTQCFSFLRWLSDFPFAALQTNAPWWFFATACAGGAWMLMPRGTPLRWAGAAPIIAMLLARAPSPEAGDFKMTVLDVGQGAAAVVETENHLLVYDTGPPFAFRIIDDFLRGHGDLDMIVVSHDDIDHSGGAARLLKARPPKVFLSSLSAGHLLRHNTNAKSCTAGDEWEWDGVHFAVLHPSGETAEGDDNAKSCVIQITAAGGTALLSGDIPREVELRLAARYGDSLRANVLLAPHHGGADSSAIPFLETVSPAAVIFSAGDGNRFGHPREDVVARAEDFGAAIYRTDKDGAIVAEFSTSGVAMTRWRDEYFRYWHRPPEKNKRRDLSIIAK